jgi:hypothetical protein
MSSSLENEKQMQFMGYKIPGRRQDEGFPGSVTSLDVPMSPRPHVPRHRTGHIPGLISTERNTLP